MVAHTLLLAAIASLLLTSFLDIQANAQSSISMEERDEWCRSQISVCYELCSSATNDNDCISEMLSFTCNCENYPTPDVAEYAGTIPNLICLHMFTNCQKDAESTSDMSKCYDEYDGICSSDSPADFVPPATTTKKPKYTLVTSSSTSQASSISSSDSDETTAPSDDSPSMPTSTSSGRSTTASTSSTSTRMDTLVALVRPTPTINNDMPLGAQNTTAPNATDTPQKGRTDFQVLAIVLGIVAGLGAFLSISVWQFITWRNRSAEKNKEEPEADRRSMFAIWKDRREEKKNDAAETDRRSIRSNRGSVLVMHEMSADAIRDHLATLEMKEGGPAESSEMLPKEVVGSRNSPAELPSHFPRSHSRLFEVEG